MHAFPSTINDSVLWHKRLGHFSFSTLKKMSSNGLVQNLPSIGNDVDVCDVTTTKNGFNLLCAPKPCVQSSVLASKGLSCHCCFRCRHRRRHAR